MTVPGKIAGCIAALIVLAACASGPPTLPYPVFVQVDELEDIFMASLPGVRAKQLSGDPQTRRTSNRIDLPDGWKGTSGAVPGRSMEIFVIDGALKVADVVLEGGGYGYFPSGSLGFNLSTEQATRILYFVNDMDPESVIRSPIIMDSRLLDWQATAKVGVTTKALRDDPGNGARTWLVKVATGASQPWESSSVLREGYLVSGNQQYAECFDGRIKQWQYAPGGYFYRPAHTISGGPESLALTESVWIMRETRGGETRTWQDCVLQPPNL